jgi:predicted MPP superfamily phosphohydrolase
MAARQTLSYPGPSPDGQRIPLEAETPKAPSLLKVSSIAIFVAIVQAILLVGHLLVYETVYYFAPASTPPAATALQITFAALSISFVCASLLAARFYNRFVRLFYTLASIWLGLFNFLFLAAILCWISYAIFAMAHVNVSRSVIISVLFGAAILIALYGIANASWIRVKRINVNLPGLPKSWQGRTAALLSDTHLGHVRGYAFISRVISMLRQLRPDIVFIAGDFFDGTKVEPKHLAAPWKHLATPLGTFYVTGNHEEFSDPGKYLAALDHCGIRVLLDEKVAVDNLQLVGVSYHTLVNAERLRSALRSAAIDPHTASILLAHAPQNLSLVEQSGISLQLSGHTHRGQVFPFTWFTSTIFKQFTYGLHRLGALTVYTSSGAGTWGPPMRIGTTPEIVLIHFD